MLEWVLRLYSPEIFVHLIVNRAPIYILPAVVHLTAWLRYLELPPGSRQCALTKPAHTATTQSGRCYAFGVDLSFSCVTVLVSRVHTTTEHNVAVSATDFRSPTLREIGLAHGSVVLLFL